MVQRGGTSGFNGFSEKNRGRIVRKEIAFFALFLFLGTSGAPAQESCVIAPGGTTPTVTFLDSGTATATMTGSLGLQCTAGTMPVVTVNGGDGASPGVYDFSGKMLNGANQIPFTGKWDTMPPGAGGTPILWTFTATATNLLAAPPGNYSTTLSFTITP